MPEWLLKEENYTPKSDTDTFINKSILSILGILSKIKVQSGEKKNIFNISVTLKVAFTFMLILLVSLTKNLTYVIIINIYLLVILSMMEGEEILKILKISLITAAFTFVILIPAVFWNKSFSSLIITLKVFATVTAINILSHSTKWNMIIGSLKRFYVPDIFIFVFDITIKYLYMLGELTLNMLYALKLRSVGKNEKKYTSLSGIAGTMFIKSKEMSEDMYFAMECRGFTGEYKVVTSRYKLNIADIIYIILNVLILIIFCILR